MATVRQHKNKLYKQVEVYEKEWDSLDMTFPAFKNAPEVLKVRSENEGDRVWIAGEYKTKKAHIDAFNNSSNIEVTIAGSKKYRTFSRDELLLHPNEIDKERLERFGYEIKDGRKNA